MGVADEYLGRGIAGELVRVTTAHAKARGFKRAQVWCTNSVSGHVFRDKLGWQLIGQVCVIHMWCKCGAYKPIINCVFLCVLGLV